MGVYPSSLAKPDIIINVLEVGRGKQRVSQRDGITGETQAAFAGFKDQRSSQDKKCAAFGNFKKETESP